MSFFDSIKAIAATVQIAKPADGKLPVAFEGHFSVANSRLHFDGQISIKGGVSVDLPGDTLEGMVASVGNLLVGGNSPSPSVPLGS